MMRIIAVCLCSILIFTGCVSSRIDTKKNRSPELTPEEMDFAEAMAHYGSGLIISDSRQSISSNALSHFVAAAKLDPDSYIPYSRAVLEMLLAGDKTNAVAWAQSYCKKHQDSYDAWIDYAQVSEAVDMPDEAVQAYKHAVTLNPTNAVLYAILAKISFRTGDDKKALSYIKQGISHNPEDKKDFLGLCHNQGRRFILSKEIKRAIPCFKFIQKNDGSQLGQYNYLIAEIYRRLNEIKKAERYYILATEEKNPLPDTFIKLSNLQRRTSIKQSIKTLERGKKMLPDDILLALASAYSYRDAGMIDQYINEYSNIISLADTVKEDSLTPEFYLSYATNCDNAGRDEMAEKILFDCLKAYPNLPAALNFLAYMWAEQNIKLDKALDFVSQALEAEPENGAFIDTLGWIYYRQGKYQKALQEGQHAVSLIRDDPVVNEHLGDIYMALGNKAEAVNYWTKSLKKDPGNCELQLKLQERNINVHELLKTIKDNKINNDECKK